MTTEQHILGYQGSPGCNFPLFVMGSGFNPFVGDDSSLTPNTDFTVLSFDTIDWLLNDTYTLFAGEQSRSGQPFQKLGRIMVEAGSSDEPFPASNDPVTPNPMSLVATLTEEEFFSETGIDIGEFVNDLLSAGHGRYLYVRFRFETCSDKDTDPDLIELQKGGSTNPESVRIVQGSSIVELPNKLFFAQFADGNFGDTTLSSQIVLVNPSDLVTAEVRIILNLGSGAPFQVDLNGEVVEGLLELMIPPGNTVIFATDGLGDIRQGSVTVCSNIKLVGVVLFSGSLGFAGVGSGSPLREAIAPVLAETGAGVNTGIAVMALGQQVTIRVTLLDAAGNVLASASVELSSLGQDALLVTDFDWDVEDLDFSDFQGSVALSGTEEFAAIVILVRPAQFATLPVE